MLLFVVLLRALVVLGVRFAMFVSGDLRKSGSTGFWESSAFLGGYRNQGSSRAHHHSRGGPRAPSEYACRACRVSRGRRARTEVAGRVA